jgi:hypothetical protein
MILFENETDWFNAFRKTQFEIPIREQARIRAGVVIRLATSLK